MQLGRTSRSRHADGEPDPFAARSRLVVAGTTALLIGVACLILGVFVSLSPASEAAAPAGGTPTQAAANVDPLANIPLTSGKAVSASAGPQLPIAPVGVKVKRTIVVPTPAAPTAAPKKSPEPTPSATPAACATWSYGDGNHNFPGSRSTLPPCPPPPGAGSWGGGGGGGGWGG
ncbi:MAG TPA: hypothetical protein VLL08_29615 [Kineosporiaceae bacterium]|nr:hypothetical protein [Kineosporiaceae bacterium]